MTPCPTFEERLLEHGELPSAERTAVDEHVAACGACREYLALLREVDAALTAEMRSINIDPQRYDVVKRIAMSAPPVARASRLTEWMDFVAAAAVCTVGYVVAWQTGLFAYAAMALSGR